MFLESCRLLKKFTFQSMLLLLGQDGKSLKKVPGQRNGAQRGWGNLSVSCRESQEPACGRLLGLPPTAGFI